MLGVDSLLDLPFRYAAASNLPLESLSFPSVLQSRLQVSVTIGIITAKHSSAPMPDVQTLLGGIRLFAQLEQRANIK